MAGSGAMPRAGRFPWKLAACLAIPALGLGELGAHAYFAARAPNEAEWRAARDVARQLRDANQVVVVAPDWAEPNARAALGGELFPMSQVARPDLSGFAGAIEVGALGAKADTASWRELERRQVGPLLIRKLENPDHRGIATPLIDPLDPKRTTVHVTGPGGERQCSWSARGRVTTGGLGGAPTKPAQRFDCGRNFAGITVIDDADERPRRCLWAEPPAGGALRIRFAKVSGRKLYGYAARPWIIERALKGAPVTLTAKVDGRTIGAFVHNEGESWTRFELPTGADGPFELELETSSEAAGQMFCFYADLRR